MRRRGVKQTDPDNRQYVHFASSGYVQSTSEICKYISYLRHLLSILLLYSYIDIADSASSCWGGQVSAMGGKNFIPIVN